MDDRRREIAPTAPAVELTARSPVTQSRRFRRVGRRTVIFAETRVLILGDTASLTGLALDTLRSPWGGHEGGWWKGSSTTFVVAPPSPSTDAAFSFDFKPLFFPVPVWVRAAVGGLAGAPWAPSGVLVGAVGGAVLLPRVFSPTLIRVTVGGSEPVPGGDGVRLPVQLSGDFSGPAELSVSRRPDGVELRSAWLEVCCNKPLPPTFAVGLHQWCERAMFLGVKAHCERRPAGQAGHAPAAE